MMNLNIVNIINGFCIFGGKFLYYIFLRMINILLKSENTKHECNFQKIKFFHLSNYI